MNIMEADASLGVTGIMARETGVLAADQKDQIRSFEASALLKLRFRTRIQHMALKEPGAFLRSFGTQRDGLDFPS